MNHQPEKYHPSPGETGQAVCELDTPPTVEIQRKERADGLSGREKGRDEDGTQSEHG